MIYLILILGTLFSVLLLYPTLSASAQATPVQTRRTELEEERELLLSQVAEFQASGANAALLTREKVRLTQVLKELENLPAAPSTAVNRRPATAIAAGLLLGVAALLLLGSLTFFKTWRYSGLAPTEVVQLRNSTRLPALERTATRTQDIADYRAWGDAAWDAQQYQVAARAYTQVLMKDREDARALRRVGFFLLGDQQMARDGLSFIQRSVAAAPKEPEGQLLLGYALGLFGQYKEGLKVLRTYQSLAPDSHEADDLIVEFQQRTGTAVSGELVYAQNCAKCHGAQGQGGTGPKLVGAPALKNAETLRQRILTGGVAMPAFPQLKGQPMDALLEYLQGF